MAGETANAAVLGALTRLENTFLECRRQCAEESIGKDEHMNLHHLQLSDALWAVPSERVIHPATSPLTPALEGINASLDHLRAVFEAEGRPREADIWIQAISYNTVFAWKAVEAGQNSTPAQTIASTINGQSADAHAADVDMHETSDNEASSRAPDTTHHGTSLQPTAKNNTSHANNLPRTHANLPKPLAQPLSEDVDDKPAKDYSVTGNEDDDMLSASLPQLNLMSINVPTAAHPLRKIGTEDFLSASVPQSFLEDVEDVEDVEDKPVAVQRMGDNKTEDLLSASVPQSFLGDLEGKPAARDQMEDNGAEDFLSISVPRAFLEDLEDKPAARDRMEDSKTEDLLSVSVPQSFYGD